MSAAIGRGGVGEPMTRSHLVALCVKVVEAQAKADRLRKNARTLCDAAPSERAENDVDLEVAERQLRWLEDQYRHDLNTYARQES